MYIISSKKTNRSARGLAEAVEENGMPKVCRKYDRVDFSGLLTELQTPQKETAVQSACDGAETKPERQSVSVERRRRTSLLSQREMRFVYSKASGILHDRDCPYVRHIADLNFEMRQDYDVRGKWCPRCYRAALIRNGLVLDETKRMEAYLKRFNALKARNADLYRLFVERGAKLYKIDRDLVYLKLHEDLWAVGMDGERCLLYHNNYYETEEHRRVMTSGLHPQRIGDIETFHYAAKIICEYKFETHLKRQKKSKEID